MKLALQALAGLVLVGACHPAKGGTADLEARIAKLEAELRRREEALEFLDKVWEQQKKSARSDDDEREPAPDAMFAVDVAHDVVRGQVEGAPSAPVTIVKAFDFACPHCAKANAVLKDLMRDNPNKIRVVYKNMVVHKDAMTAHLASCAAAKQGKYNEFRDAFWKQGYGPFAASGGRDKTSLGGDTIIKIAEELHLDVSKLKVDMAGVECEKAIAEDMADLAKFHVDGTPTFFVNGTEIPGGMPLEEFQQLVDEKLKQVEASGVPAGDYYQKVVLAKGERKFRAKSDPKPH